jgi:hypothetical protein
LSTVTRVAGGIRTRNRPYEASRSHATSQTLKLRTHLQHLLRKCASRAKSNRLWKKFREESALTEPGFEPEPCGLYHEVTVNFTIPGNTSPADCFKSK